MECPRCGTELVARARYCHQCGERATGQTLNLSEDQIADEGARRPWWMIAAGALLALTILLWLTRGLWLGVEPPAPPPPRPKVAAPKQAVRTYYALRATRLRRTKTTEEDNVIRQIGRGEEVKGVIETGLDGKTLWLNTDRQGPYVAAMNMAETAPLPLDLALDRMFAAEAPVTLYRAPGDDEGYSLDTVATGTELHISGVINGWFEVTLRQGGVAYFKPIDGKAKKEMAKALETISEAANGDK